MTQACSTLPLMGMHAFGGQREGSLLAAFLRAAQQPAFDLLVGLLPGPWCLKKRVKLMRTHDTTL